jgi:hypothetical protein
MCWRERSCKLEFILFYLLRASRVPNMGLMLSRRNSFWRANTALQMSRSSTLPNWLRIQSHMWWAVSALGSACLLLFVKDGNESEGVFYKKKNSEHSIDYEPHQSCQHWAGLCACKPIEMRAMQNSFKKEKNNKSWLIEFPSFLSNLKNGAYGNVGFFAAVHKNTLARPGFTVVQQKFGEKRLSARNTISLSLNTYEW